MFSLLSKYNRGIAWFFAIILYMELIAVPLAAQAESVLWAHDTYGLDHSKYVRTALAPLGTNIDRSGVAIDNSKNFSPKDEIVIYSKKNTDQKFGTGPTQPEMQSFQSVNTNNMVDLFTGDFSYNIPLLDVGGYPVNIHYQSGITMDQESSWVGLGWNINPGTITRNMRGLPDDFKGDSDGVSKTVSMKPNITSGVALGGSGEFTGIPFLGLDASVSLFHNNYKGWGIETSVKPSINAAIGSKGSLTGSLSLSNNSQNGLDISPNMGVALGKQDAKTTGQISIGTNMNSRTGIQALQLTAQVRQHVNDQKKVRFELGTGISSYISFAQPSYTPTISIPFTSRQYAYKFKQGLAGSLFFTSGYVRGYQSSQLIDESDKTVLLPSYGYLYYEKANNSNSVLLDFNREKDIPYREKTPHIAVPIYTYDTYSISGEGTGGMFRPYRGDIGYVYDHVMATKSKSNDFTFENGGGNLFHGGAEVALVNAVTKNNPWLVDNFFKDAIGFKERDTSYENVYFKNPGEKGIADSAYLEMIGNDNLMRVDLSPLNAQSLPTITASRNFSLFKNGQLLQHKPLAASSITRSQRDKRTQVISYLTAGEASLVGLQKKIRSYSLNSFPATSCNTNYTDFSRIDYNRKSYHVSEIDVLNPDGRKYVYGIPVYNLSQEDVAMATKSGDGSNSTGMTSYVAGVDNTIKNNNGKDAYYSREKLPPYSHSFLLTGILSSDYVDLTGDGITEDDMGDAIKFNYTQVYNSINPYKWRAPFEANQASYNEGLKTDNRDEKGSYTYGTREQWYLNSIESKTMIATFIIDTAGRYDSYGVTGENGGMDASQRLYRLKQINLYTKADYLKNGPTNAKPVKTVNFEYSHELCTNLPNSSGNTGKLTLKKIWFSYNKNDKGKQNPYIFDYNISDTTNPSYNHKSYDRWGNYKDASKNPGPTTGAMTNMDYPYALQIGDVSPSNNQWDSTQAARAVSFWNLSQIELPSGGKIKVSYESDDYAYVQNKRAMQFFSIIGFGNSSTAATGNFNLYSVAGDNNFIFIKVTDPAASKEEVLRKYLEGVSKLYFKVAVKMPNDKWGQGYEMVPCYADIISYGVIGNPSDRKIWIQVKPIKDNENPIATSAIQFLRLNLPSKAFPYSEPGDQLSVKSLMGMLASVSPNLIQTLKGYEAYARKKGLCKVVLAGQSFVRLNNPIYKKLGGGLRVKQLTIEDNWDVMTGAQMKKTTYGQQYDYTTTTIVNGVATKISSGVATYEPSLGNDENPFHIPFRLYTESEGIRAPTNYMYAEEPFAETFFPSPMVGYSKVTVQTINKTQKSAVGYEETEFFTSKEFPTIVEITPLDNESKKTYNPKIQKLFRFNAKHFVTLSQGFKVELNDMNGKVKSQSTYAQNDLKNPISYTLNYYKLQNDFNGQKKLSSTVAAVDSISGRVKTNAEMGKEVEIMVDVREQVSTSISSSVELNIDVTSMGPLIIGIPSAIPVPSSETNRYRSIAILKIVNRYGILDSVIHMEKGSRVATRNLLYDGETGDVLVSQTNNEFDDPLYNFSYPAHWVNSGMGLAYKNIGATFKNMQLHQGKLFYANGRDTFSVIKHFESGDELLAIGQFTRNTTYAADTCQNSFYLFSGKLDTIPIWVIDAAKGYEKKSGLFFIDRLGKPVSGAIAYMKIIRSGKRNLASTQVGSVTTMQSPIKLVNSSFRLVLDSTLGVLGANAFRFVDFWKVDSTSFAKDTTIISSRMVDIQPITIVAGGKVFSIKKFKPKKGSRRFYDEPAYGAFEASSYDKGNNNEDMERRSWVGFDFSGIPNGARIKSAVLSMQSKQGLPHLNNRNSTNSTYLERVKGRWIGDMIGSSVGAVKDKVMEQYFNTNGLGVTDIANRVTISATTPNVESYNPFNSQDISPLVQAMVDDYYAKQYDPALIIRLSTSSGDRNGSINRMAFQIKTDKFDKIPGYPKLVIEYYMPCNDLSKAIYATYPVPGYYCYNTPKDSFVCRPNIVDTAVNPYRWGILGNWRVDRSYTYFDRRKDSDPLSTTNIRTNGEIKSFMPFWNFSSSIWQASQDSSRWVWNSEVTLFNKKGFEIENKDPLGRYNSGQYGYNQTLPVAVVQNSKNKVSMFDGFEDYDYRTDTCKKCPAPRFVDLTTGGGARVDTISHTGKYSLRLSGNTTASVPIKVTGLIADSLTRLSIPVVTTTYTDTTIVPVGTGLNGYYSFNAGRSWLTPSPVVDPKIDFDWGTGAPKPGMPANWFDITWRGNVQPLFTDNYTFYLNSDDGSGLSIYLNNTWVSLIDQTLGDNRDGDGKVDFGRKSKFTVQLQAGILYKIEVKLKERKERSKIKLAWSSSKETPHVIPQNQLYIESTSQVNVSGTIVTNTRTCVRMYTTKPSKVTNSLFAPEQGTKVVFSAWVKEAQPCITGSYANVSVQLSFNAGSPAQVTLVPKGNIIEGWQRIEDTVTIPATATSVSVVFKATSSTPVYFDDVRWHPYNSNMKSFVYSPINIRLMAELDENNYATFYEYDDDGTLIRVKKETERGIKTIKETRSALFKK